MSSVRTFWTIEMAEKTNLDDTEFEDDVKALNFVSKLRELNDPAFKPVTLLKHEVTTTEKITPMSLGVSQQEIVRRVQERLLKQGGNVDPGVNALEWAVMATLEAQDE